MKLFWRKGYAATSLDDLLTVMQIGRGSFYASFTDKRSLFVECLKLFGQGTRAFARSENMRADPVAVVRCFFESTLTGVPEHRLQKGCMLVNTVLELADNDPELCHLASQELQAVQTSFEQAFRSARRQGTLKSRLSPHELACYVMTVNQGLRVQSRKSASPKELQAIVDTSLSLIGLAT